MRFREFPNKWPAAFQWAAEIYEKYVPNIFQQLGRYDKTYEKYEEIYKAIGMFNCFIGSIEERYRILRNSNRYSTVFFQAGLYAFSSEIRALNIVVTVVSNFFRPSYRFAFVKVLMSFNGCMTWFAKAHN